MLFNQKYLSKSLTNLFLLLINKDETIILPVEVIIIKAMGKLFRHKYIEIILIKEISNIERNNEHHRNDSLTDIL